MATPSQIDRQFVVVGDRELERKLQAMTRRVVGEGARKAVRAGSTPMLQAMKPTIPVGPTRNLQKSLRRKIKRNPKMPGNPYTANVFVAAQHAHLVRWGTKGPRKLKNRYGPFLSKRRAVMSNMNRPYANKGFIQRGRGGLAGGGAGYYRLTARNASGTWGQTAKGTFFGKQVARMPANPGFSRTYEQHRQQFIDIVTQTMLAVVDSARTAA